MIKIDDLIDELNKYEIPNEDEAISWFINGDKNATLENWRFYQRCILGMLHIDEHFGSACKTKADFEQLEMLLKLRNSQTDVTNEIKNLIDAFLSSDSVSNSHLFENNELINYIKLFAGTSNLPFYNVEVDESKVREIKASIKQYNETIKILSSASERIKQGEKVSAKFLKRQKVVKLNAFMSKNKKIKLIDEKIVELKEKVSQMTEKLALEELNAKKKYINDVIEFLSSEHIDKNNTLYETLKNDLASLSDSQLQDIPIEYLKQFGSLFSFFSKEMNGKQYLKNMKKDIIACAQIYKYFWNEKWSKDKGFMELCNIIRRSLTKVRAQSDFRIDNKLRESQLASDNDGFIQGASLNKEQIVRGMEILSQRYEDIMKISDTTKYVSECAKFLHDFIMIHPFSDGNGRTSRMLLQVMLAKRNILLPSLFDSDYHRIQSVYQKIGMKKGVIYEYLDNFSTAGNLTSYNNDYTYIIDYIINRVQQFNPGLIPMVTEESIRKVAEQVDKEKSEDMVCNIIAELENYKREEVTLDESRSQKSLH